MTRQALRELLRPGSVEAALRLFSMPDTMPIAGGTDLTTLILDGQCDPSRLIDVGRLPGLSGVATEATGALRIGASTRMADVANHPIVQERCPAVAEALLAGATPQLRAMATVGGNLMQRTRCPYYRAPASMMYACNKRAPGTGCAAIRGENRSHAILGGSDHCVATHPSDLAVPLVAFDATVVLRGSNGERRMSVASFLLPPDDSPMRDTALRPGELIIEILLPRIPAARRARYVKLRDRASYEFALVSAVAGLDLAEDGAVRDARVAAGGVGTVPWRLPAVEAALRGQPASAAAFDAAAGLAADGAQPLSGNAFKPEMLRRTVRRALEMAWSGA